ncbi:hypothetical protein [Quadrisphaera sp. DSM 44207]|uniref:hypothetical protein n=1 Tax=Quadrisphaera sp. DSM 44207 TaxID=1881057 RepID=UPI0008838215|nr:hypothetical protein [Quadrisphaera sp. DSM 44207]SDQ20228.1 hypothetical protein SAMN05428996_1059 [Quadrisphaera sp. DSM 44207]
MSPRPGDDGGWARSWHDALTAAELDLDETEAMLARLHASGDAALDPPAPWRPPTGLGPLPVGEADRARAILARHHQVALGLTAAMSGNRQHRRVTASAAQRPAASPVYIDTAV